MSYPNLLTNFKRKLVQQDLAPASIKGYLYDIAHFFNWLQDLEGKVVLKKIFSSDLRAYRQELRNIRHQKAASVNRRLQSLKRFFAWASIAKLIRTDPALEIRFVRRAPATQPRALMKNEVHALLRVAGQSPHGMAKRNYAILQIMLQAGLRVGEVVKLQYRDLDLKERSGMVRIVDSKGFKEREVPLNVTVRRALFAYFKTRDKLKPTSPVFITKQVVASTVRAVQMMVANLAKRAKITRILTSAHTLRHTFATNYLKANPGDLVELAALLGHVSLNTTAVYTKASREKLAQGVERSEINIYDE